jgi:p-hydroxybenzoate 3-monooxygenase
MTDSVHDADGPALNGPFRQMTALARLDELFDSSVAGRLRGDHTRGVAWQAGRPMPA